MVGQSNPESGQDPDNAHTEFRIFCPIHGKAKGADPTLNQLQDLCREAKERKHMTAQEIADESGVPLSTVNNFFAAASRLPAIGTAGPICRVLDVSMDSYYGIAPAERDLLDEIERLRAQYHDTELVNARLAAENDLLTRSSSGNRRNSLILLVFNTILTIALLCYLIIDANIRNAGLILFGEPSAAAYALIALSALSFAVIIAGAVQILRRKK